jgi:PAS domain S-box-containing protein
MPVRYRPVTARYGFALATLAIALVVRWLLGPILGQELAGAGLLLAIFASAWYGGFVPAALVSVAGPLTMGYLFPDASADADSLVGAILYFLIAFGIALLGSGMSAARRRAEVAAEELRTTLLSIGDAVLVTDASGRVKSLNPIAEELTGWNSAEAVGQPLEAVFVIVHEHTRQRVNSPVTKVLREGSIVGLANHTVLIAKDGTETAIDDSAAPIRGSSGQVIGVVLVFRDVTERRRAAEELRREQEMARFLADASAELASLVDYDSTLQKVARLSVPFFADWCAVDMVEPDGGLRRVAVAHVDPAKVELAHRLYAQFPPDASAQQGIWNIVRTGQPEFVREITEKMLRESIRDADHLEMVRQLGLRSYIGVPIEARGQVLGTIVFLYSETDRRYTEGDLAVAEDLAHRAAVAIENARLYQAVRNADQRKDEFLAMLAHELRNPLAPIRTGLELLALEDSQQRDTIGLMQEQVGHLVRLVDDLLDVSRIVRGKVELRLESLSLEGVVNQTVAAVRPVMEAREQELDVCLPDSPIWVSADSVRLAQVLENLLNNASKYTDRGGKIELVASLQGHDAVVSVHDNGIGIEPELLPFVFELFTQSSRALDRAQGGLGIGLTLVRNLVEMHGGSVSAQSGGPGQGSIFTIRLPAVDAGTYAAPPPPALLPTDVTRRVLVVDDNVTAARMLAQLIVHLGPHEVETAHDGCTALRRVEEQRPDIVLLDIGLPGMDGYEVARAIRADSAINSVLLVAVTGYGQEEDRRKSREAGFDEHLVKPAAIGAIALLFQHPKLRAVLEN